MIYDVNQKGLIMKNTEKEYAKKLAFVRLNLKDTRNDCKVEVDTKITRGTLYNARNVIKRIGDTSLNTLYDYFKSAS